MIKYIILLFTKFLRTEIIGFIELTIWLIIKNLDIYLMLWNTESVRPTMILSLLIIPLLSAIQEYQQKKRELSRSAGILLHPTSLYTPYGIGDFGPQAFEFIDYLKKCGQTKLRYKFLAIVD